MFSYFVVCDAIYIYLKDQQSNNDLVNQFYPHEILTYHDLH